MVSWRYKDMEEILNASDLDEMFEDRSEKLVALNLAKILIFKEVWE